MLVVFNEATEMEKENENACNYVNNVNRIKKMCFEAEMIK